MSTADSVAMLFLTVFGFFIGALVSDNPRQEIIDTDKV